MRKLHIGCGDHPIDGWENTDIAPCGAGIRYLDATEPFGIADASIDRIYSEHMIEHVPLAGGLAMLGECYRVLRLGGRIRISTPGLEFLIDLVRRPNLASDAYVKWACAAFSPGLPVCAETVINNFVRAWGHQFIWSRDTLASEMHRIGFRQFCWPRIAESTVPEFVGLENAARMPEGFLQLETMTVEAEKPA